MKLEVQVDQVAQDLEDANLFFGHGTDNAFDEAVWLVLEALGFDAGADDIPWTQDLTEHQRDSVHDLLSKRIETRQPLAYLVNKAWFAGHEFFIDSRAIVPRSHIGEWIPDRFDPWLANENVSAILDLCTGGGCIAVSLALAFPEATVDASDLSQDALDVARRNVERYGVEKRVRIIEGDLFSGIGNKKYDLIVCNPPYVSDELMSALPKEYHYEPELAFAGGQTGLDFIQRLLKEAADHLSPEGFLVVEAGSAQQALETAYVKMPFTWLMSENEESVVFMISADELAALS